MAELDEMDSSEYRTWRAFILTVEPYEREQAEKNSKRR